MSLSHETIRDDKQTQLYFSVVDAANALLPAHWHSHLEIISLTDGQMTAYINEISYELYPGDILIVNPKDIHYTHAHGNCRYYLLQIPPVHLERVSAEWQMLHFCEFIPFAADEKTLSFQLTGIMKEILRLHVQKEKGHHLLLLIQLYRLLYLLYTEDATILSEQIKSRTERDFLRMEQSMRYVKEHFREQITLAQAAEHLSLTPEYFCRLFKKYTGQTFFTYVAQIRLLQFYQDLLQTDESITFLLEKNGITNYRQFMRMFKEAYGTTPHRLRKETLLHAQKPQ